MEKGEEFVGDLGDLVQVEENDTFEIRNVPVEVDGPVQVHLVPSVASGSRSFVGVGTTSQRVANDNPRRRSITAISIDQNFVYGTTQNECDSGYGAVWPKLVPLVLTHSDQVYVKASASTTTISVVEENWAS